MRLGPLEPESRWGAAPASSGWFLFLWVLWAWMALGSSLCSRPPPHCPRLHRSFSSRFLVGSCTSFAWKEGEPRWAPQTLALVTGTERAV